MQETVQTRRKPAWPVALFFLALLALGLLTSAGYGQPWDEPWEQDILRMNLNQYAAAFGLTTRLTLTSSIDKPLDGLIANSVEKDHGECAYYPALWLVGDTGLPAASRMVLWHAYTWLWFMAGAAALWCVARRLGLSRLLSCVATLFLVLSPRMFAEGHYNNKDLVLLSLVLLTLWQALRLMERPSFVRALLFSLAGAAAANIKVIGVMVWGLCSLFVLVRQCAGRRMTGRIWGVTIVTLLGFVGFYALLTPALWSDPLAYLRYTLGNATSFSRWEGNVLFRGEIVKTAAVSLPRSYLPYMIAVTTPLWVLFLFGLGQVCAAARLFRRHSRPFADDTAMALLLCTLLWLLPLGYAVLTSAKVYNGWRHLYFIYGPMLALGAYGLACVNRKLAAMRSPTPRRVAAGLLALCMAMTGTLMATAYPNEFAYYNVLTANRDLPEYLELDYWNVSVLQTLRAAVEQLPPGRSGTIAGAEYWSQNGLESAYLLLDDVQRSRLRVLPEGSKGADYVLSNRTYAVLTHWSPQADLHVIVRTSGYGQTLCTLYMRDLP